MFTSVTFVPGTTAPVASVTRPVSVARVCPQDTGVIAAAMSSADHIETEIETELPFIGAPPENLATKTGVPLGKLALYPKREVCIES